MRRLSLWVGSTLVFALLLGVLQTGRADEETAEGADDVVEILATQPLALEDFLKAAGLHARIPFFWDPGTQGLARSQITMPKNLRVTRSGLFELIRTVLASYELTLVPIGPQGHEVYRVMAMRDLSGSAIVQPRFIELDRHDADELREQHGLLISTTLRTVHVSDLSSARTALLSHATRDGVGRIEILPDLPGFAVTDFAPAVIAIRDALQQIDTPSPEPRIPARVTKRIELEHADAAETAAGLARHLGANLPLPAPPSATPTMRGAPVLGLRILADERTNALLVSGSPERVTDVQEAVTLLDVPAERPSTWIHVYRLEHLDVEATARALLELAAAGGVLHGGKDAPPTTIVADRQTNALLVEATPRVFEQLLYVLQELDKPKPDEQPADEAR